MIDPKKVAIDWTARRKHPSEVIRLARIIHKGLGIDPIPAQATAYTLYARYLSTGTRTASDLMAKVAQVIEVPGQPLCRFIEAKWASDDSPWGKVAGTPGGGGSGGGGGGDTGVSAPDGGGVIQGEGPEEPEMEDDFNDQIEDAEGFGEPPEDIFAEVGLYPARAVNATYHIARMLGEEHDTALAGSLYAAQIVNRYSEKLLSRL